MLPKKENAAQLSFYSTFEEQLSHRHPLFILAGKINWLAFEESFAKHYREGFGRPAKPIRLMVSLLMLKHLRNLSDESVVEQWGEMPTISISADRKRLLAKNLVKHPSWFISGTVSEQKG